MSLPPSYFHRYPAELSGGEKQRVAIARAFAAGPGPGDLRRAHIVSGRVGAGLAHEPAGRPAREQGTSYLFISHDLAAVQHLSHRIGVMYLGRLMEEGEAARVLSPPYHPYTEALLSAIPLPDPSRAAGAGAPALGRAGHQRDPVRLPLPPSVPALSGRHLPRPGAAVAHGRRRRPAAGDANRRRSRPRRTITPSTVTSPWTNWPRFRRRNRWAAFVIRRLGFVVLTVLLSSVLVFGATNVLPGDVATMVLGREASQQAKDNLRKELGLDRPLVVQYGSWLGHLARGDWGTSLSTREEVRAVTLERLGNSAMLALVAFLMYVPLGIFLGVIAAWRRNSALDQVISAGSLAFVGLPEFVTAVLLIALFSRVLGWLPSSSAIAPGTSFVAALPSLILPGLTVSLTSLAYVVRMTRASTADVLETDYVRTARLKGLSTSQVLFGHVLRNSLLPTVTVVAAGVGWLMGGLIVTESVFGYPGLGRLVLFAVQRRDLPLIQATTMLIVTIFALANLAADIIYALLNPRIRYR